MGEPFIGEIKMVSFNWAPRNWTLCNGQLESIGSNQALFSLIGSTFGGNARTNFAIPDLRGRVPIGPDSQSGLRQGSFGGLETVALSAQEMPPHTHQMNGSTQTGGDVGFATSTFGVTAAGKEVYGRATNLVAMNHGALPGTGGGTGAGHSNIQPSTVINFIMALEGTYPSRN